VLPRRISPRAIAWFTLLGAAAAGWSIDHYLAATKHNADAAQIARLAPIEAAQQQKVDELRTKLFEEKAKRRSQQKSNALGGVPKAPH